MDFLARPTESDSYDAEIQALGSRLIPCPRHRNPIAYAHHFARVLREHGPYQFVHSHMHHWSGFVSFLAHRHGVAVRIVHSHGITDGIAANFPLAREVYLRCMKACIRKYATHGLAASEQAAEALYGPQWRNDKRWQILYCGRDFRPFAERAEREVVRQELGIPLDAKVIGHIGRFIPLKNHTFLVDVAAAVMRDPCIWLLLVGDGELRPTIEHKVQTLVLPTALFLPVYVKMYHAYYGEQ